MIEMRVRGARQYHIREYERFSNTYWSRPSGLTAVSTANKFSRLQGFPRGDQHRRVSGVANGLLGQQLVYEIPDPYCRLRIERLRNEHYHGQRLQIDESGGLYFFNVQQCTAFIENLDLKRFSRMFGHWPVQSKIREINAQV